MKSGDEPKDEQPASQEEIQNSILRIAGREALFRALAETTSAAIFIVQGLDIRYANPAARIITGYTPGQLLGMQIWQIAHPAYQNVLKGRNLGNPWAAGLPSRYELKILTQAGIERWIDLSIGEMEFEGGPAWILTAFDITERDLAERELRKAKEELETRVAERTAELLQLERQAQARADQMDLIFKSMVDAVVVYDAEDIIRQANAAAIATFGFHPLGLTRREMLARLSVRQPDGRPLSVEEIPSDRAAHGEVTSGVPLLITNAQGRQLVIHASAAPLYDPNGELLGSVVVWHDVSEREQLLARIEEEHARVERLASALKIERDLLLSIMENTHTHLAYLDADFNFLLVNSTYARGSGYSAEQLIGKNHFDLFPDAENQSIFERVRDRGEGVEFLAKPFEFENQPERGTTYWDWTLIPVKDEAGNVQGLVFSLLDVTEKVRAAQEIQAAQIRAEQAALEALRRADELQALAVENARLYAAQAQRAQELDALHQATAALLTTLDLESLINQILDAALSAIPAAEKGSLSLVTHETGELKLHAATAAKGVSGRGEPGLQAGSPARLAIDARKPILIHDLHAEPAFRGSHAAGAFRSAVIAPLILDERVLGVLSLECFRPGAFTQADLRLLASFANTTTTAIHNATLHSEVQRQAITDSGTGMYNRRGFFEFGRREIERARRFRHPLSAIMLDIDHFKQVNDAYTHAIGDQVLQGLARRLSENLRDVDILGRYGGEEFSILLPETDLFTAAGVAERLRKCVEDNPFPTDCGELSITISLGLSKATAETYDLGSLLEKADIALYAAKGAGRNRVEVR